MAAHEIHNMKFLAQDTLAGFGGMGEGMSIQEVKDGRRIIWLAHEGPPKNFTGVDVTDPRNPKVVVQTDLPHEFVRSNSLEVVGDILAVAYQTRAEAGSLKPGFGRDPAGIELFDISDPENPKSISFYDCSGPFSMGVHQLWFVDGEYIHFAGGAPDVEPHYPSDCQFYRSIDVRNPSKPVEVGRWWYPGTMKGDAEDPPPRHPQFNSGYRIHNTNVYPDRPDRVYSCYLDGGAVILDISDMANPTVVGQWNPHPPFPGFAHTALPLLSRDLMIVTDESVRDAAEDWPKLTWVVDIRDESKPIPISTLPMPPKEDFIHRGGRFGSHNLHENRPGPAYRSDRFIFGTFFNGGLRVYDLENPYRPEEIAFFIPEAPAGSKAGAAQINDVYVDENQIVYCVDRFSGGLYILEIEVEI